MIQKVVLRRFKRFADETFDFGGSHIVLAGPNNSGKTTVLQAIAAWAFAMERWRRLNDFQRHGGSYTRCPITRQTFSAVPLRTFELLWKDRQFTHPIEVEIQASAGWRVTMEFIPDSTEQVYVRPKPVDPDVVRKASLSAVFVPPMSGLGTEEPVYQPPKIEQLLGQSRPGEVIRNLLLTAYNNQQTWQQLSATIKELFHFDLLPPDGTGADIVAEYRINGGAKFDIASAGSGFQQVLMLLTFLNTRQGAVLLLDEPDAHLHIFLQEAIFQRLREAAIRSKSQLIVATHAEVIIDSVDLTELCVLVDRPIRISTPEQRKALSQALRVIDNVDIMNVHITPGVIYVEDYTDLEILRAFSKVLSHPAQQLLSPQVYWKPMVSDKEVGQRGIRAKDHFDALRLVKGDLRAVELVDGDSRPELQATAITGIGLQRLRWTRYEIESYLLHPAALERFVELKVGSGTASAKHRADLRKYLEDNLPPAVLKDPLANHDYLNNTKARTKLIPPALNAAGLLNEIPYTEYFEIAAVMRPDEVHPEVKQKLDDICRALGMPAGAPAVQAAGGPA